MVKAVTVQGKTNSLVVKTSSKRITKSISKNLDVPIHVHEKILKMKLTTYTSTLLLMISVSCRSGGKRSQV